MKILIVKGIEVMVDDDDFEHLSSMTWYINAKYVRRSLNSKEKIWMHRYVIKASKGQYVDHIDGNRLNNQKNNLRICNQTQNNANKKKATRGKTSKYKGVCFDKYKKKFVAYTTFDSKIYRLGMFKNEQDAARAYNKKAIELFGEFAKLNEVHP